MNPSLVEPFTYRVITLNTSVAFDRQEFAMDGDVLVYMSPVNGPDLELFLNEREGDPVLFTPKSRFAGKVERFWLTLNTPAAGISEVKLYVASPGDHLIESQEIRVASVEHTTAMTATRSAISFGSAVALPISADANRQKLTIRNAGLNPVWLGGSGVSAGGGFGLDPGESLVFTNFTGLIYAFCEIENGVLDLISEG